jgi:hypothetical protein
MGSNLGLSERQINVQAIDVQISVEGIALNNSLVLLAYFRLDQAKYLV